MCELGLHQGHKRVASEMCLKPTVVALLSKHCIECLHAGNAIYSASSAATTVAPGLETSSTSLSVAPMSPVVTESATFLIALESGGPGTPPLSGKTVSVDFGDGPIETGVTDSTGQVTLMHTYNVTGAFSVVASFAGEKLKSVCLSSAPACCC